MSLPQPRVRSLPLRQQLIVGNSLAARWRQLTLGARVWRVAAGALTALVAVKALYDLIVWQWLGNGYFLPGWVTLVTSLLLPTLLCAALAAGLQRWLSRFQPLTQVALFGASAYVGAVLLNVMLWSPMLFSGASQGTGDGCGAAGDCFQQFWQIALLLGGLSLPYLFVAVLGYGLALASLAPRGRWIALAAAVVATLLGTWAVVGTLVRAGGAG